MTARDPNNLMNTDNVDDSFDYMFKIIMLGDSATGKTCILDKFKTEDLRNRYTMTLGLDLVTEIIIVDDKRVKLQIWDTAGQERFRSIMQSYYRTAHGVILVYDITKRPTFLNLEKWFDEIRRNTSLNSLVILAGNKCDMEYARQVTKSEGEIVCKFIPEIFHFIETSAKEGTNINSMFYCLASELIKRDNQSNTNRNENDINLNKNRGLPPEKKKNSCC
ncbi:ras-related protein Rab-13 [Phymastichus coffea]|uniref:ras-related protein Rab-13 n=1 Tax=Phymastichus coffea TaxID=108790 RepID=UPI00273BBC32|nr:ras-related protein Rab-13 [Phymastichus coffea]